MFGEFTGDFEACSLWLLCVWGHFTAKLKNNGASITTNLDLTGLKTGDKLVPRPQLEDFKMILDDDDIEIDISDSIVAWAVNLFIYFFKWAILPDIVHNIQEQVPVDFNADMNAFAVDTKGLFDTGFYDMGFDFSYSSPQSVSPEHLQLFFNGTVFNYTQGENVPSEGFANMHVDNTTTQSIQAGMSEQMIDSFSSYVHNSGELFGTLNKTNIPQSKSYWMSSDEFEKFLPGMVARYGTGEDVEVLFATYEAPLAIIENGKIGTMLQFDMHVICKGEEAIVGRVINGKAEISVEFADFELTVQMTAFQVDDLKQMSSVIGKQDLSGLALYLNLNADIYIPVLNTLIPVITIPQIMDGVKIESATF